MTKITFENLPSTNTPINADNLNDMQDNIEDAIDGLSSYGQWTPSLSCVNTSAAPTVEYSSRSGTYSKLKINNNISIVFVLFSIRGKITAVSSASSNYATIAGLPFNSAVGAPSINFNNFYKAIADDHPLPTGFVNNNFIRVQSSVPPSRGGGVEFWNVYPETFEIQGSGFYFTED